jgi:hypothetical protein
MDFCTHESSSIASDLQIFILFYCAQSINQFEHFRERFGDPKIVPDRRRSVSEIAHLFPHVNFDLVPNEDDKWHRPRETPEEMQQRAETALRFLAERPEYGEFKNRV